MPRSPLTLLLCLALVAGIPVSAMAQSAEAAVAAEDKATTPASEREAVHATAEAESEAVQATAEAESEALQATAETASDLQFLDAADVVLDDFLWTKRVLLVFAETEADPRFIQQLQLINQRPQDLVSRDVVVVLDTDPGAKSDVRKTLRPRGFALVMVDKDGVVKLRKPSPWSTREIGRTIDKTPLRRQEIRDRHGSAG